MATAKIVQKRNNTTEITVSGELTIYSVSDLFQSYFREITFKELVVVKLSAIEEVDTAGVQLLVMIFKMIAQQKSHYIVKSMSETLIEYTKLFNLQHYFSLDNNTESKEAK